MNIEVGQRWRTRDGSMARVICTNAKVGGTPNETMVVVLVSSRGVSMPGEEAIMLGHDGRYYVHPDNTSGDDLMVKLT